MSNNIENPELLSAVVRIVVEWLESVGGNPFFHDARSAYPQLDAFQLGAALQAYRRRHGLVHPGRLRRRQLRKKFNASFNAVERGVAPMTVKLKAEIARRVAEETMEAA